MITKNSSQLQSTYLTVTFTYNQASLSFIQLFVLQTATLHYVDIYDKNHT